MPVLIFLYFYAGSGTSTDFSVVCQDNSGFSQYWIDLIIKIVLYSEPPLHPAYDNLEIPMILFSSSISSLAA